MRNDNITIQKRNSSFLKFGLIFLCLLVAGLFLIALRFLSFGPKEDPLRLILTIAGGVLAGAGLIGYVLFLIRGVSKKDALIITNKGFTNLLVGGKEGVYLEWISVKSLKVFGLRKAPMLGISLTDEDAYMQCLSGRDLRETQYNRSIGLPIITISQKDVRTDIEELKNLFSRMIKGAISWENYSRQDQRKEQPRPTEYKTFAERRQEAEARAAAAARRKAPDENQISLFPTSELNPDKAEPVQETELPAGEQTPAYEDTPEVREDGPVVLPGSEQPYGEPVCEDDPIDEDEPDAAFDGYRPCEPDAPAGRSAMPDPDSDDDPIELEDDEDPVPVEDVPAASPFASFDKTATRDAVTILDIDDE